MRGVEWLSRLEWGGVKPSAVERKWRDVDWSEVERSGVAVLGNLALTIFHNVLHSHALQYLPILTLPLGSLPALQVQPFCLMIVTCLHTLGNSDEYSVLMDQVTSQTLCFAFLTLL